MWSLVRHTAGLLKKRVEDLAEVILMFILSRFLSIILMDFLIKLLILKCESRGSIAILPSKKISSFLKWLLLLVDKFLREASS